MQEQFIKSCPDIKIKVLAGAILVTLLPTLKIFFSIEIKFWKTSFRILSQGLGSFQDKYLWRSSDLLVKALFLWFTVILLTILKLMILRNFTEVHLKPSRVSKMEHFVKIVSVGKPLTIFATSVILDVRQNSEYAFALL